MVGHLSIFSFWSNVSKMLRPSVRKRLPCFSNVEYTTAFTIKGIHYISILASNLECIFWSFHRLLIIQKRTNRTLWFWTRAPAREQKILKFRTNQMISQFLSSFISHKGGSLKYCPIEGSLCRMFWFWYTIFLLEWPKGERGWQE